MKFCIVRCPCDGWMVTIRGWAAYSHLGQDSRCFYYHWAQDQEPPRTYMPLTWIPA